MKPSDKKPEIERASLFLDRRRGNATGCGMVDILSRVRDQQPAPAMNRQD
ncbi:hypothetical protein [Mesorhizobium australicum]|nr:hypothetical protein [Mesorhizobium australicum]